ncbi:MAG TPA: serine hydrolase domain-containing protein [Pyrinomonadaceae bacterium]|nr:serine hydrolase domain-containing protein [Pyrinomonadaceae bacterium]
MKNTEICLYTFAKNANLKTGKAIFLFCLLTAGFCLQAFAQTPATTAAADAAEQRGRAFVEAINSNNRMTWRKFISENFAKAALERVPIEERLNNFARIYDQTRGFNLQTARRTKPNEVVLSVKGNLTGIGMELMFMVDEESPFYLRGIGMRPPETPQPSGKKLSDKEVIAELDDFLKKVSAADVFSGAVLVAKGDNVLFEKAYGEANKDFKALNNAGTKFNLGSMNKMFTSVAIAQLVEAGKLSFDDSLSKFMPDFPDKEAAEKIKIKHLLSHTSGLGNYFNRTFMESSRARFRTIDDFLALAKDEKMQFEPGSRWQYSNTGMLVLGKVIEKASGQNYYDYIRENIYKKAGMTSSDAYDLDNVNPNLAVGYEKDFTEQGAVFRNNIFMHVIRGGPAGGGYSTVGDLLRFARALQSGKLVGREYVKLLTSPKPELNSPNYGYGFGVGANPATTGHSGGFPGISSELIIFTDSDYTAVVLSNYGGGSQSVTAKIRALVQSCADCQTAAKN